MERLRAVVHLDLDGGAHIFRAHGWRYDVTDDPLFESGLRSALDFFDENGVRATLFAIAEDLASPAKLALLREAVRRGHEVASHSVTHRLLPALSRDEKRREIVESRERLAHSLGVEVIGFRAPGFAIDRESLHLVAEAGYRFDSSLFPGAVRVLPDAGLLELTMPAYRPLPFPYHPSYSLVLGGWYFRLGLRLASRRDTPLVMLFHLTDFAEPMPSAMLPHPLARIYTLSHLSRATKHARCTRMLQHVAREYDIVATHRLVATLA